MAGDKRPSSPFDRPRIYAAFTLITAAAVLPVLDALSRDYAVSDTTVGLLIAGGAAMLGVEGLAALRRKD